MDGSTESASEEDVVVCLISPLLSTNMNATSMRERNKIALVHSQIPSTKPAPWYSVKKRSSHNGKQEEDNMLRHSPSLCCHWCYIVGYPIIAIGGINRSNTASPPVLLQYIPVKTSTHTNHNRHAILNTTKQ
eukprot:12693139-Ditylum_brightwellii.AAC.1